MRTVKGAARNKAKRRLYKKAKGYRGGRGKSAANGQGNSRQGQRRTLIAIAKSEA